MSSLEKWLLKSFSHFLIGLSVFLVLSCMSCLYILEINPLSVASFAIIFFHSEGCLFTLLILSYAVQKLLNLIRTHLFTFVFISITLGGGSSEKAVAPNSSTLAWKIPWNGWRSLEGCSPWGRWGSDTTERLHFHFSLSCVGGGNGNPLQCSCLENPRDGGAWWAAVYGVAQSRTQLKWLSSSRRWVTEDLALIYVIEFYSFWSYI